MSSQRNQEEQEDEDIQQAIRKSFEQLENDQQEDDEHRWLISAAMAESAEQHNREQLDDDAFHQSLSMTLDRSKAGLNAEQRGDEVIMQKAQTPVKTKFTNFVHPSSVAFSGASHHPPSPSAAHRRVAPS